MNMKRHHPHKPKCTPQPRKRFNTSDSTHQSKRRSSQPKSPDSLSNDSFSSDNEPIQGKQEQEEEEDDENLYETAAEKRIRLAKLYLDEMQLNQDNGSDSSDNDDHTHMKLRDQVHQSENRLWRNLASTFFNAETSSSIVPVKFPRAHQLSITCLTVSPDSKYIYSGSKDGSIIQWNLATKKKLKTIPGLTKDAPTTSIGHTTTIQCITTSSMYVISGGGVRVNIWTLDTLSFVTSFTTHRDSVTGCTVFGTDLYTCSADRTIKSYDLQELTYVETLFGHQDQVTCMDVMPGNKNQIVSSGGRDQSIRVWKVLDETQLVYRPKCPTSVDLVVAVSPDLFVTGDQLGDLCLWHVQKKKCVFTVSAAHGTESDTGHPHWITALTNIKLSDMLVSGSSDGSVKCWRVDRDKCSLSLIATVPIPAGMVNGLQLVEHGTELHLFIGMGQEHKLGRWSRIKEARNAIYQVTLGHS